MSLIEKTKEIQGLVGAKPDGIYGPNTAARVLSALKTRVHQDEPEEPTEKEEFDERTIRNLRTLEPNAQKKFIPFIRHAKAVANGFGVEYIGISGTRGKTEQNNLYAKGRTKPGPRVTNARYGYSNHNFGIAMDFGVFRGRNYLDGSASNADRDLAAKVHKAVSAISDQYGIEWGGSWNGFKDLPHFEVETGLSMAEKRRRLFNYEPMI